MISACLRIPFLFVFWSIELDRVLKIKLYIAYGLFRSNPAAS